MVRTTLDIPDPVLRKLKRRAVRCGATMSSLAAEYIRFGLEEEQRTRNLPPLPTYDGGPFLVDVTNRDALSELLDDGRHRAPIGRKHE